MYCLKLPAEQVAMVTSKSLETNLVISCPCWEAMLLFPTLNELPIHNPRLVS